MNKDLRNELIKILQSGNEIPEEYKDLIFPSLNKEYELTYTGKMKKEDILRNEDGVSAVPFQKNKTFYGKNNDNWENMIVYGENLQFLKNIYINEDPIIKDKIKGKVKLIYICPC